MVFKCLRYTSLTRKRYGNFEIMLGSRRPFLIRILQKHDNHNNDDKNNKIFSNFSLLY